MDNEALGHRGPDSGAETVYGTHEDNTMVMSEKTKLRLPRKLPIPEKYEWKCTSDVQSLAASIYQEFERMIQRYDEDVVKTLMPLLVNVLECLDAAYRANQEQDVEVELLREDNEQLVTQYEREKSARKQTEQKLLETEDVAEAENKELASRLESLESIVRMLELKHKNSLEHASRLEERESELKKEYSKLHDRYTELFKTHVDYMERTKMLMGSTHSQMSSASDRIEVNRARLNPIIRSSGPISYGFASLENSAMLDTETICSVGSGSDDSGPPSLQNELDNVQTMERAAETDTLHQINQATSPQSDTSPIVPNPPMGKVGRTTTKKEQRSANTLYQELSFQDNEESEEHEVTGSWVHPGEYASSANDNYFGMGKEVENLIMENNELLATKNALNIVKDDLIVKVDELTGEIEILREELNAMSQSRNKLRQKVSELEEELKKTKEQVKQQNDSEHENESDIPMAQRKRFTRVEMAMVLMERNQYKERLMELQEAVRFTEIVRATRAGELVKNPKNSIWKYFSNLFSSPNRPQREQSSGTLRYNSSGNYHGSPVHSEGRANIMSSGSTTGISNALVLAKDYSDESTSERVSARRREQYRQLRAHVQKEDGRMHAYGWSLPEIKSSQEHHQKHAGGVPVPVPVCCNPIAEGSPHMKVFCATGVTLRGGYTKDGCCLVESALLYPKPTAKITEITSPTGDPSENLDRHMTLPLDSPDPQSELSSLVWICRSTHAASTVTVVDANQAATVLDAFPVCQTHLLCVASVIGALEKDYALLENSELIKAGETLEKPGEDPDEFGKVEYIRLNRKKGDLNENTETKASIDVAEAVENGVQSNANENGDTPSTAEEVKVTSSSSSRELSQKTNNNASYHWDMSRPVNPILGTHNRIDEPSISSVGPTMWLGAQNGMLYVHSAVSRWHECLHKIQLQEPVLSIVHLESRVVVALANAKLAVFRRQTDGQWDLNSYHLVTLGEPKHAIRCLCVVGDKIWAAYRNKIFIVDPISLNVVYTLEAHPRKESQVKQMVTTGLGVWVSIRLDSTLRLYHANTYEHIQDVDIEPYVSKMLGTGKLGFSFARITALMISCNRLWIGTGNGVIISVPLTDASGSATNPNTFIPRCCMANAQLSFHGHRDAVKFFVSVPMPQTANGPIQIHNNKKRDMLVMCGGEGYIDFRQGDNDMERSIHLEPNQTVENRGEKSYLIVWHVTQP